MTSLPTPQRVAMLAVHTSPLAQPGTGDAGGLNVYVVETARRLEELGVVGAGAQAAGEAENLHDYAC